jgi:hypothetical protein
LVKVRVKAFRGFRRAGRTYLIALFGRNASKAEEAAHKNGSHEAVLGVKEADLAPPRPTLLFTKQALSHANGSAERWE